MTKSVISVIPGDGIGPEVIESAIASIKATGLKNLEFNYLDFGADRYNKGEPSITTDEYESIAKSDAILLGAIGWPTVERGVLEREILLGLRFTFGFWANLRPVFDAEKDIDILIVREISEGNYIGEGGIAHRDTKNAIATQGSITSWRGVERITRLAFERAQKRKSKLTWVHKANVLNFSGPLWNQVVNDVAKEFPKVSLDYMHIDTMCMELIKNPHKYDVILTDHMFGDILSDVAAGVTCHGIGAASSGMYNFVQNNDSKLKKAFAMFEPVHGSAPKRTGKNTANPFAAILAASMMLDFLGYTKEANMLEDACRQTKHEDNLTETTRNVINLIKRQSKDI